jgi:hypothetical protein
LKAMHASKLQLFYEMYPQTALILPEIS